MTCSLAFSRAWRRLHVFASRSDWLSGLSASVVIGRSDYIGFTKLDRKLRYYLYLFNFSPNTSSSSSSPTDRSSWPQDADSDDQDKFSFTRKMKRTRSCLSKSKRRRSPGTPKAVAKDVHKLADPNSGLTKGSCSHDDPRNNSSQEYSKAHTEEIASCSCSDSEHDVTQCRLPVDECPSITGSPISIPGRKAKRRKRWNSNSDSSLESKHLSAHELSSDEMSDLEPQFIPDLTNDSMEFTEEEQFRNVTLQFSESRLEEEVRKSLPSWSKMKTLKLPYSCTDSNVRTAL